MRLWRGPWSGHTRLGWVMGRGPVCGPRGYWELYFLLRAPDEKILVATSQPWMEEIKGVAGPTLRSVCLSLSSTERLISGSQRSKPAKPSTEPPSWSRSSQSASQVRCTRGTLGSDSKRGPPLGGWFRERCPLWVGAALWHMDRRIRKRCPSGPDSLLPPTPSHRGGRQL